MWNAGDQRFYENITGCGNTVNCEHPQVRALIVDCLKYWVEDMHVDGFRFDLATVLGRDGGGFNEQSPLFKALRADKRYAEVPFVLMCSLPETNIANRISGYTAFLHKPFKVDDVIEAVRQVLGPPTP